MNRKSLVWIVLLLELAAGGWLWAVRPAGPPLPELPADDPLRADLERLLHDNSLTTWHSAAEIYAALGYYAEAEACYRYLLQRRPKNPQWQLEAGFLLSQAGRWEEGNAHYEAALAAGDPRPWEIWYLIGRNYLRGEQAEQAELAFAEAEGFDAARLELARLTLRRGEALQALERLAPLLESDGDKIEPNLLAYQCALAQGDQQAAARYAQQAADTTQRMDTPFYRHWQRLEEAYNRVGSRQRLQAAVDAMEQNRLEEAESLLRESIRAQWNENSVRLLAQLAAQQGDYLRAIALLRDVQRRRGPSTGLMDQMADCHAAMNDMVAAIETMRQGVEAQTVEDLSAAYGKLSRGSEAVGRSADAARYADLAVLAQGKAAFWQGNWQEAEKHLLAAAQRMPNAAEVQHFLAETQRRLAQ